MGIQKDKWVVAAQLKEGKKRNASEIAKQEEKDEVGGLLRLLPEREVC